MQSTHARHHGTWNLPRCGPNLNVQVYKAPSSLSCLPCPTQDTLPASCPLLQPHAPPISPSSDQALAHFHVVMLHFLLPLLGKPYFPSLSHSPALRLQSSLEPQCVAYFILVCGTRAVCTTTPAQKPVSISTLVMRGTLPLSHCHSHKVSHSHTLSLF